MSDREAGAINNGSVDGSVFREHRRVEFRDTDAAGIMHFSTFFTYMEEVEHDFLRSQGKTVMPSGPGPHISWPRVAAECEYRVPLRFEDEFDVEMGVTRLGRKSVTYGFRFLRGDALHATGSITAVCCVMERGEAPQSVDIPVDFQELLRPFVQSAGT